MRIADEDHISRTSQRFIERWQESVDVCVDRAETGFCRLSVKSGDRLPLRIGNTNYVYFVSKGHFQVDLSQGSDMRTLRLCGPASLVGYGAWIADDNSYSILALENSVITRYTRELLERIQIQSNSANRIIIEALCQIISTKDQRIFALEQISAVTRVKLLLHSLSKKFGIPDVNGSLIGVGVSRKSLAQLAGVTTESFSRILTDLEEEGIVRRRRRSIVVADEARLQAIS